MKLEGRLWPHYPPAGPDKQRAAEAGLERVLRRCVGAGLGAGPGPHRELRTATAAPRASALAAGSWGTNTSSGA